MKKLILLLVAFTLPVFAEEPPPTLYARSEVGVITLTWEPCDIKFDAPVGEYPLAAHASDAEGVVHEGCWAPDIGYVHAVFPEQEGVLTYRSVLFSPEIPQ